MTTPIALIAKVCHEVNRAYCLSHGDSSHKPWAEAPEWVQGSALASVLHRLNNPGLGPREQHEAWRAAKVKDGWRYGPVKSADTKHHPCVLPYDALPPAQKVKDLLFGAVVDAFRATEAGDDDDGA